MWKRSLGSMWGVVYYENWNASDIWQTLNSILKKRGICIKKRGICIKKQNFFNSYNKATPIYKYIYNFQNWEKIFCSKYVDSQILNGIGKTI